MCYLIFPFHSFRRLKHQRGDFQTHKFPRCSRSHSYSPSKTPTFAWFRRRPTGSTPDLHMDSKLSQFHRHRLSSRVFPAITIVWHWSRLCLSYLYTMLYLQARDAFLNLQRSYLRNLDSSCFVSCHSYLSIHSTLSHNELRYVLVCTRIQLS